MQRVSKTQQALVNQLWYRVRVNILASRFLTHGQLSLLISNLLHISHNPATGPYVSRLPSSADTLVIRSDRERTTQVPANKFNLEPKDSVEPSSARIVRLDWM